MFGTFIRFFPMFDFKNNDADHVIVTDIDYISENNIERNIFIIQSYLILKKHKKLDNLYLVFNNDLSLGKKSKQDKNLEYDNYLENLQTIIPHIAAGLIFNIKRFINKILVNYLINIDSNNEVHSSYSKDKKILYNRFKSNNKKFVFGVDEYFLNKVLLKYIDENKLEFCARIKYNIINLIYDTLFYNKKMRTDITEKEIGFFTKFFNFILKDIDKFKFTNIQDAFNLMDKYTYSKNNSPKKNIIFKRLYAFYKICRDKKIKYLNPNYINFILDDMKNKIQIDEYRFYYSKKTPIIQEEIILQ
jgi:hypothetical protein